MLNLNDIVNLQKLLSRVQLNGLAEAQVAVALNHKLEVTAKELSTPPSAEQVADEVVAAQE